MASEEEEKKIKLRKKIEYQVACEEKAFKIVERLIENPVPEQVFIDGLQFITPNHYSDIVEERAVSHLCGYPICGNQLSNVPKQKYVISTKTNKVYDIEARKNFCSGKCYKASLYLQKQISSSPVWSRQKQPPVRFELLSLDGESGFVGDEVKLSLREEAKDELAKLAKLDTYQEALKKKQDQGKDSSQSDVKVNKVKKNKKSDSGDSVEQSGALYEADYKKVTSNLTVNTGEERANYEEVHEIDSDDECVYTLEKALEEMNIDNSDDGSETCEANTKVADSREIDCGPSGEHASKDNSFISNQTKIPEIKQELVAIQAANGNATEIQSISIENETLPDRTSGVSDKSLKNDSKCSDVVHETGESKTDYLMKLLDKRKSLLAKMADIQPFAETDLKPCNQGNVTDSLKNNLGNVNQNDTCKNKSKRTEMAVQDKIVMIESDEYKVTNDNEGIEWRSSIKKVTKSSLLNDKAVTDSNATIQPVCDSKSDRKGRNVSTLQLICKTIHAWMTVESLEYLNTEDSKEMVKDKSEFEKQYKALEARIDKQERDFGDMLGEEAMNEEDLTEKPSAPLPHFEVLKKEVEDDTIRVREYLKGSLTYKVEERDALSKKEGGPLIVLPSVDRYDQMLIRQRIVLDRISKVLPDLLSPLHLLIQDVFTDVRELVATFNLTKDNVLFTPAEWILVTIVILKLISGRNSSVRKGFDSPEASKYFTVVWRGANSSLEEFDTCVTHLRKCASKQEK